MKKTITIFIFLSLVIAALADMLHSNGQAAAVGSPGETGSCNRSMCHNQFVLNSGGGSISITCPTMPGWEYTPGVTYSITITVAKTGTPKFGFAMEALRVSDNRSTGTMIPSVPTHTLSASVSGFQRISMVHDSMTGFTTGSHAWTFDWRAPATDEGNVKLWAAGNAANHNWMASGDYIYTTSQVLTSPLTAKINEMASQNTFAVYPNPIASDCNIQLADKFAGMNCSIEMYDAKGNLVHAKENIIFSAGEALPFSIGEYTAEGMYFLRIVANGTTLMKKVVVRRS
jgi:hypothetical protein